MPNEDNFPGRVEFVIDKVGGPSEFARKTGVTLSTIARWRKGEADPSRSNLIKVAEVAGVSIEWLATGKTLPTNDDFYQENELDTDYRKHSAGRYSDFVDLFEFVPMHNDIIVSAGYGGLNDEEFEPNNVLAFRKDWLASKGVKAKDCEVFFATGDSMYPTICDKDLLLIDHSRNQLRDGKIYVINYDGTMLVKRVQIDFNKIILISDNKDLYKSITVKKDEEERLKVMGEVVHIGHDLA